MIMTQNNFYTSNHYVWFVDFKKALDLISHDKLWVTSALY